MNTLQTTLLIGTTAGALLIPSQALAQGTRAQTFTAALRPLNNSGVNGTATLRLDGGQLTVQIRAAGLVANQPHPQHIHGKPDGSAATCPTAAAAGPDNVLTLEEGLPSYGPVMLPLEPFPMGTPITFQHTYTSNVDQVTPLTQHVVVLHGANVGGQYQATLPVACGTIVAGAAALPATGSGPVRTASWALPAAIMAGLSTAGAGLAAFVRRRK